jgi:hypothetical protein
LDSREEIDMTFRPLAGLAAALAAVWVPAPAPASTTVPRTVLIEEFGWHT